MDGLPEELRTLRNIITAAEDDTKISLLRLIIKSSVDEAPPHAVIEMAKYVYDRGVEIERLRRA